jgi:hypothetical protein
MQGSASRPWGGVILVEAPAKHAPGHNRCLFVRQGAQCGGAEPEWGDSRHTGLCLESRAETSVRQRRCAKLECTPLLPTGLDDLRDDMR